MPLGVCSHDPKFGTTYDLLEDAQSLWPPAADATTPKNASSVRTHSEHRKLPLRRSWTPAATGSAVHARGARAVFHSSDPFSTISPLLSFASAGGSSPHSHTLSLTQWQRRSI